MVNLSGTKELIFDTAVSLIADKGYENVSMRDIAVHVGIKASSIYNHFESKSQILDYIYEYYEENIFVNRVMEEEIHEIIRFGSKDDIIQGFTSTSFLDMDNKISIRMIYIAKIMYARIFSDQKAAELFVKITKESIDYIKSSLDFGVEVGRLEPFDTEIYATFFVAQYHQMGIMAFIKPDYQPVELYEESKIKNIMKNILPLKNEE